MYFWLQFKLPFGIRWPHTILYLMEFGHSTCEGMLVQWAGKQWEQDGTWTEIFSMLRKTTSKNIPQQLKREVGDSAFHFRLCGVPSRSFRKVITLVATVAVLDWRSTRTTIPDFSYQLITWESSTRSLRLFQFSPYIKKKKKDRSTRNGLLGCTQDARRQGLLLGLLYRCSGPRTWVVLGCLPKL